MIISSRRKNRAISFVNGLQMFCLDIIQRIRQHHRRNAVLHAFRRVQQCRCSEQRTFGLIMRKLVGTIGIAAFATGAFAQGIVFGGNNIATVFLTNSVGIGGTTGFAIATQLQGNFFYELLVNQSTVTTVDSSLQNLLAAGWSDTQFSGTNIGPIGGRISGGLGVANNWPPLTMESFMVVGWTAAEAGGGTTGFNTLMSELSGAHFDGAVWHGGNLIYGGFVGVSTIQQAIPGDDQFSINFSLFGTFGTPQGTPIETPTTLWVVPEPAFFALAGLGAAALMIFRRRD